MTLYDKYVIEHCIPSSLDMFLTPGKVYLTVLGMMLCSLLPVSQLVIYMEKVNCDCQLLASVVTTSIIFTNK